MLTVLALAGCEKLINRAIATDIFTQHALRDLSGKTLRLIIDTPEFAVDVLFSETRIRFEPVASAIFEPQGGMMIMPDCTVHVATPTQLLALIDTPAGNLPISGDHRVLLQIQNLIDNFSPDIWQQIEALVGMDVASHLQLWQHELTPILQPLGAFAKEAMQELINIANPKPDLAIRTLDGEIREKKDALLRLQSELERSQAKLDALNAQLTTLTESSPSTTTNSSK